MDNGERVRYIGIDCPEIAHNGSKGEFFGEEAKVANINLVDKKIVSLYFDKQKRDDYRRVLAYVFVDTVFVNKWLVEYGYAHAKSYQPNVRYDLMFKMLENEAKSNKRGIWKRELYISIL
ncbi:MAG: thermonuclease family protein [Candidatus Helarchaeota archaeon]|nr:thermonuclease family protein [Candidatus Helarchaeota archaeon]